ncbi:hypothetical protein ILFOPFJJ_02985 [Ensifer psoraleae]|uniref:hypothetical protein n=1 Tax=Sinorhizobium psoraleae TaxID=520838 RepID=UPI00156809C3|nr:hypothetical protein [Sinorhizobium psoraleae]NRP72089.1 hypothetical protein [Sinorhizobium psoraleae]
MDLRFSELAIGDEEIAMLQRVHSHACGINDVEPESEQGLDIGKMLFSLYQQGIRGELSLIQMLTARKYGED